MSGNYARALYTTRLYCRKPRRILTRGCFFSLLELSLLICHATIKRTASCGPLKTLEHAGSKEFKGVLNQVPIIPTGVNLWVLMRYLYLNIQQQNIILMRYFYLDIQQQNIVLQCWLRLCHFSRHL